MNLTIDLYENKIYFYISEKDLKFFSELIKNDTFINSNFINLEKTNTKRFFKDYYFNIYITRDKVFEDIPWFYKEFKYKIYPILKDKILTIPSKREKPAEKIETFPPVGEKMPTDILIDEKLSYIEYIKGNSSITVYFKNISNYPIEIPSQIINSSSSCGLIGYNKEGYIIYDPSSFYLQPNESSHTLYQCQKSYDIINSSNNEDLVTFPLSIKKDKGIIKYLYIKNLEIRKYENISILASHLLIKRKALLVSVKNIGKEIQNLSKTNLNITKWNSIISSVYDSCELVAVKKNNNSREFPNLENLKILPEETLDMFFLCKKNLEKNAIFSSMIDFTGENLFTKSYPFTMTVDEYGDIENFWF